MSQRKRILALILTACLLAGLSGCAYRPPVQQGTILTNSDIRSVRRGMTREEVLHRLGKPVLTNIFPDSRLLYVYTLKPNRKPRQERQLRIYFRSGRVVDIKVYSSANYKPPV